MNAGKSELGDKRPEDDVGRVDGEWLCTNMNQIWKPCTSSFEFEHHWKAISAALP